MKAAVHRRPAAALRAATATRRPPTGRAALLDWLCRRQLHPARRDALRPRRRRRAAAAGRQRARRLHGPGAARDGVPGPAEDVKRNLSPAADDERIVDIDYCINGRAIHHLEPLEDVLVREWSADGALAGMTLALGRFAKGAFTAKAADIPLLKEKLTCILEELRRHAELARLARDARALQPLPQARAVLRAARRPLNDHRPHGLHRRRRRDRGRSRARARATRRSRSPSRVALLVVGGGGRCAAALQRGVRRRSSSATRPTSAPGRHRLLLRRRRSSSADRRRHGARADARRASRPGRTGSPLDSSRRSARARAGGSSTGTSAREPQRPLPRGDAAGGGAGRPPRSSRRSRAASR